MAHAECLLSGSCRFQTDGLMLVIQINADLVCGRWLLDNEHMLTCAKWRAVSFRSESTERKRPLDSV